MRWHGFVTVCMYLAMYIVGAYAACVHKAELKHSYAPQWHNFTKTSDIYKQLMTCANSDMYE